MTKQKLPLLRFYMVTCKKEIINCEAVCRSKTLLEKKETPDIHKSLSNFPASSPKKSRDLNEGLVMRNSQNEAIFVVPDALICESCKAGCSHTLQDFPADASNSANNFTFYVNKHQKINEEDLDYNYINYEISKSPEECQKEDKQCTEHEISNDTVFTTLSNDSNIIVFGPSFNSDDLSDTIPLEFTTCFMEFELIVRRGNSMEDIVHTFEKNPEIDHVCTLKMKRLLPSGEMEEADDFGRVIHDASAEFWEEFYNKCTLGKAFRVPFLRHDFTLSKWRAIAKVILIRYEQCRYFPVQLAQAFMQQVFFGSIAKNSTLLDSFMKFVPPMESEVLQMAISNFTEVELPGLIEVLQGHSCKRLPKADNIQRITIGDRA
ncbi:uncharacterized protein LOC120534041 isoform X1 [Polypterus senegalus]|uniref:uncharacterized protein LOC120534041 isoform X1 n=1 Tax=Polypterus senegalus TaxID=55291 RepID=UPI001965F7D2|nr:uncharacterized protein LOC120534041 isoform X1 [Polypterus senegalus]